MPSGYGGGQPSQPSKTNGMSIASLVLGLVGVPLCFLLIPSVLAIVFGIVGMKQIGNDPTQKGRGLAIAGVILGAVMLVLIALAFAFGDTEFTFES